MKSLLIAAIAFLPSMAAAETLSPVNAHGFDFISIEGEALPLEQFRGKAVLVVNTASRCGFTHQYDALQALWSDYRDQGLVVLGVPSNDFGSQERGTEAEIKEFCEVNFAIDFPMTSKVKVKGADAHPFYRWAAKELGAKAKPRWNFHKYLIAPDGALVGWFPSSTAPNAKQVVTQVEAHLPGQMESGS
ncbi:glutathione peroxidase [Denitrobaculum tricleocarpae]|uniref:Glutathione peroxidase n=2 Tax=Denitrobaculum tricleocarpae TaxID=2591009 RepID=A0A545TB84_9PROT|nr:glutathione peroxidase [Denitrobaculum tricleocarpae]TQV74478.1 glutathione peroxidase [Denitrobaculum tricleocarpae]